MNFEIIKNDSNFSRLVYDTFLVVRRFVSFDMATRDLDFRLALLLELSEKRHATRHRLRLIIVQFCVSYSPAGSSRGSLRRKFRG